MGRALPSMFSIISALLALAPPRWLNSVPFSTSVRVKDEVGTLTDSS